MNYRHIYHAGNFADILKHIILARIIEYFKLKEKAFRVIDTHAGPGLYDLLAQEAQKTHEYKNGLERFLAQDFSQTALELLAPWRNVIQQFNEAEQPLRFYPGSPLLIRRLLRKQDRLTAIELHPADFLQLQTNLTGDYQSKPIKLDGWLALKAQLPAKEKRAIVLVDPPFEEAAEHQRLVYGLAQAYKRCATATYILWYPIKYYATHKNFIKSLTELGIAKITNIELFINSFDKTIKESDKTKFAMPGCGLILVNAPYILAAELQTLSPYLIKGLGQAEKASLSVRNLT